MKAPICKCGRKMIKNKGNIDIWICPSRDERAKTRHYAKSLKLYHGTDRKNLKSILKNGLKRIGDKTYIYTTPNKIIAKKYGNVVLEIEASGLDLRVWSKEKTDGQIMIMGDVKSKQIKALKEL